VYVEEKKEKKGPPPLLCAVCAVYAVYAAVCAVCCVLCAVESLISANTGGALLLTLHRPPFSYTRYLNHY
jgi:hypothetical protein